MENKSMTKSELLAIAKPILFNTDMVQAVLDDRKNVTRRIAKHIAQSDDEGLYFNIFRKGEWTGPISREQVIEEYAPCKAGDILYVRETWSEWTDGYVYKAWTSPFPQPGRYADAVMMWHPSIHMPKEAARIFLKVTDVRVERLQDIDGLGAYNEGVTAEVPSILKGLKYPDDFESWTEARKDKYFQDAARHSYIAELELANCLIADFGKIWDSTILKKDLDKYGWKANPWVWVIEFERVQV